jgi:heat shock protein HslJ
MWRQSRSRALLCFACIAVVMPVPLAAARAADPSTGLQGRTWVLKGIGSQLKPVRGEVTLRLEKGQIIGRGGINTFKGDYKIEAGKLALGPLMSTRMAGDPDLMMQEQSYLGAMAKATSFVAEPYRLTLSDAAGKLLLMFEPLGVSEANRPVIHAPARGESIGPNVAVAGRTGSGRSGLISVMTDTYVSGVLRSSVPGHRSRTTPGGKYRLRVATPRPTDAAEGQGLSYIIRVVELNAQSQPRGPEAFIVLYPRK